MYQGSDTRIDYNILGTPGAGEAFLLNPQSAAANTFSQLVADDLRYKQYERSLLNQQRAARRQASIENLKSFKIGDHFIADNQELQKKYETAMTAASQVMDSGGDPYDDPKVLSMQQEVMADAALSKAHKDEYTAGVKLISEKPNAYRNVKEWMDWYALPLSKRKEAISKGILAPTLEPLFTEKSLVDLVPAAKQTDSNGNRKVWGGDPISVQTQLDRLHDTKEFQFVLEDKYKASPTIGHFGTRTQAGVLAYPTDDLYVGKYADHLIQAAQEDPTIYRELGIDPTQSTDLKGDVMRIIKHQNAAYANLTRNVVSASAAKIEKGYEKEYKAEEMKYRWAQHGLATRKFEFQKANEAPKIKERQYLDTLSHSVLQLKGNENAIQEMKALLEAKNGKIADQKDRILIQLPLKADKGMYWTTNSKKQWVQKPMPEKPEEPIASKLEDLEGVSKTDPAYIEAKTAWDKYHKERKQWEQAHDQPLRYVDHIIKKRDGQAAITRLRNVYKEIGLLKDNDVPEQYGYDPDNMLNDE